MIIKIIQVILILWFSISQSHAADALVLGNDSLPQIRLNSYIQVNYSDVKSFEKLQQLPDNSWQSMNLKDTQSVGVSKIWLRVNIENEGNHKIRLLAFNNPLLDEISLFHLQNDQLVEHLVMGDKLPFLQRPIKTTDFMYPIELAPRSKHTFYIHIDTRGSIHLKFMLLTPTMMYQQIESQMLFSGIQLGALAAIGLFAIFIALTSGSLSYAYYSGYVLSMTLLVSVINGFAHRFLWPNVPEIQQLAIPILVPIVMVFAVLFTEKLLKIKHYSHVLKLCCNM